MVPIPNKPGEFLAVQKYYRLWIGKRRSLYGYESIKTKCNCNDLVTLPYIHRFDLLERNGQLYLLACTVATYKPTLKNGQSPVLYTVQSSDSPDIPLKLEVLRDDFYKNHGYAS